MNPITAKLCILFKVILSEKTLNNLTQMLSKLYIWPLLRYFIVYNSLEKLASLPWVDTTLFLNIFLP